MDLGKAEKLFTLLCSWRNKKQANNYIDTIN